MATTADQPTRQIVYKQTSQCELLLDVFMPERRAATPYAAIVFFHGGGWNNGNPSQFYRQAAHLAGRGMVGISATYRLGQTDQTTPFDAVKDAFSAMRWVRAHADELAIDPNRIAAGGGSAGGHLAAATATLTAEWTSEGEHVEVSPRPDALILFNPAFDNSPTGWGHDRIGDRWESFSPMANLHAEMPPTLTMTGSEDALLPIQTVLHFQQQMRAAGCTSEAVIFGGAAHGFFNNEPYFSQTLALAEIFLESLGYLAGGEKLNASASATDS